MIVIHFLALIILFYTLNELTKPYRTYKYNDEPAKPQVNKPTNRLKTQSTYKTQIVKPINKLKDDRHR